MLRKTFDPLRPLVVALYLRMSSDQQNARSPDQQRDTIRAAYTRAGYPWIVVEEFIDAGVSGRLTAKRPGLQGLLRKIRTGELAVDAILVDTFERFGRSAEANALRAELADHYGVLVLTADSGFADPTSTAGQALSAIEGIRATEDTRVKAHNVLRGKRDAARRKRWPGGEPPFGYRLESVLTDRNGRSEVDHSFLVPDPPTAAIVKSIFGLAADRGWGCSRIARTLNDDPEVPAAHKPFYSQTVNYWLSRPIYKGELVWEEHSTGVVGDRRVIERNAAADHVRVPDFCEPLVPADVWETVQTVRAARAARTRAARAAGGPKVRGLALRHPLSGLVVCGACGLAMTPSSSRAYVTKGTGEAKRYTGYVCPRAADGGCANRGRVPAAWLNDVVFGLVRDRLFPAPAGTASGRWDAAALAAAPWFADLVDRVRVEWDRLAAGPADRRPILEIELAGLRDQIRGCAESLAKTTLNPAVRQVLEEKVAAAADRERAVEAELAALAVGADRVTAVADPAAVADRVNRLADVLAAANPTRTNIELALHVEGIHCHADGRVVVRTCRLGALAGGVDLFATPGPAAPAAAGRGTPRKRGARRLDTADAGPALRAVADRATDVTRFAGLGPEWFAEDEFRVPGPTCWSKANAAAVAALRKQDWTHERLARHFGKTVPTIRKALKFAAAADPGLAARPRKTPRPRWPELHFSAVAALRAEGKTLAELCTHFGKSEPLIRTALRLAADAPAK